jgi:hypothetical protein
VGKRLVNRRYRSDDIVFGKVAGTCLAGSINGMPESVIWMEGGARHTLWRSGLMGR